MENYFTQELKQLKREITNIKTSAQKSAGSIKTSVQSVSMSVDLQIVDSGLPVAKKEYIIESNTTDLAMVTLDNYYADIYRNDHSSNPSRSTKLFVYRVDDTRLRADVIFKGDENDWNTISGGGTVSMSATMTIRCTNNFTISEV